MSGCTLKHTKGTIQRQVNGRDYWVNVPEGLPGPSVPLLLGLHGFLQSPVRDPAQPLELGDHETATGWSKIAGIKKFIVAYPCAQRRLSAWDSGQGSDDVAYLRDVVRDISSMWCVDPRRVYVEGHSSGALMAARLACDAPEVFASVVVYSGVDPTLFGGPCAERGSSARPISVGIFHGVNDLISIFPLAKHHRDKWIDRNGCSKTPKTEPNVPVEASVYGPGTAGVEVACVSTGRDTYGPPVPIARTSSTACGSSSCVIRSLPARESDGCHEQRRAPPPERRTVQRSGLGRFRRWSVQ